MARHPRVHITDTWYGAVVGHARVAIWSWDALTRTFTGVCELDLPYIGHSSAKFMMQDADMSRGPSACAEGHGLLEIDVLSPTAYGLLIVDKCRMIALVRRVLNTRRWPTETPPVISWREWAFCTRLCTGHAWALHGHRVVVHRGGTLPSHDPERVSRWSVLEFAFLQRDLQNTSRGINGGVSRVIPSTDILSTDYLMCSPWSSDDWFGHSLPCVENVVDGPPCPPGSSLYLDSDRLVIVPVRVPLFCHCHLAYFN